MLLAFTLLSSAQPSFTCTTGAVLIQLIAFTWRQLPSAVEQRMAGLTSALAKAQRAAAMRVEL